MLRSRARPSRFIFYLNSWKPGYYFGSRTKTWYEDLSKLLSSKLSYAMQWCPQILIDFVFKVIHSLTESKMSANPAVWGLKWMVLEVVDRNALLTSFHSITNTTWLFFLKTQERSFVLASLERLGQMWMIFTATCFLPNLITVVRLLLDYDHSMEKAWHLLVARTSECLSLKFFWYPKKWTFF